MNYIHWIINKKNKNYLLQIITLSLIFLIFSLFILYLIIKWISENITSIAIMALFAAGFSIIGLITYEIVKKQNKKRKEEYEKNQISKGLLKFVDRNGKEYWGDAEEVNDWAVKDAEIHENEKIINQIAYEIGRFTSSRKYKNEFPYQEELYNYLRSKFKNVRMEESKGRSRPDISVGDIAIEIKGPTTTKELQTIADKCIRYVQHFNGLIIVLFEVQVYSQRYKEWKKGIRNQFPNVLIIEK